MIRKMPDETGRKIQYGFDPVRTDMQDHVFSISFDIRGRAENTDLTDSTSNYPLFVPSSPESSGVSGDDLLEMSIQRYTIHTATRPFALSPGWDDDQFRVWDGRV
jgi:hypothetical protein